MFAWSKNIMKKINDAGCLSDEELQAVEIDLRMSDVYDNICDEALGVSETNNYELQHNVNILEIGATMPKH